MRIEDFPEQEKESRVSCGAIIVFLGGCALAAVAYWIFG